jgi:predicted histone-like DNA-binding protein
MAINYRIVQKGKPGDPESEKLYYAIPVKSGTTSFKKIIKLVTMRCTAHSSDVKAVLDAYFEVVREELDAGRGVEVDDLFKMRVSFSCNGKKMEEDISPKDITKKKVIFKVGEDFRDMLKGLEFKKIK